MENLEIQVQQQLGTISTNFEEIEKELRLQMSAYESFVVSEDEISVAKGDLAFLRKLRTSIDDKRKEIKREYLVPYNEFETSCKKLLEIIDQPIELIDSQIKMFDADRAAKKRERITKLYNEQVGDLIRFLPIEKNYNPKWNNKSYSTQDIAYDISEMVLKVKNDLGAIRALHSEIEEDCITAYAESGNDLSKAIARNSQYLADKEKVVEQVKKEIPTNPEPQSEIVKKPIEKLDDFASMIRTVKVTMPYKDWEEVKATLDFMGVKYTVEGE